MTVLPITPKNKPESLDQVWTEKELAERLGLPTTKSGKSQVLSNWRRGGLKFAEKSGRNYFFEGDVIDYLWSRRNTGSEPFEEQG